MKIISETIMIIFGAFALLGALMLTILKAFYLVPKFLITYFLDKRLIKRIEKERETRLNGS